MKENLKKGIIEVRIKFPFPVKKMHYMQHQAVVRQDHATTKVYVVYAVSQKIHGPLLNNCLIPGESRILELFRILLRFQIYRLGIVADIMKAHLNISVVSEDRDVLSLLWVDNI